MVRNLLPASVSILAMVSASGKVGSEKLHVKKIIFSNSAKNIVDDSLRAGSQEVAEFWSVSAYDMWIVYFPESRCQINTV